MTVHARDEPLRLANRALPASGIVDTCQTEPAMAALAAEPLELVVQLVVVRAVLVDREVEAAGDARELAAA